MPSIVNWYTLDELLFVVFTDRVREEYKDLMVLGYHFEFGIISDWDCIDNFSYTLKVNFPVGGRASFQGKSLIDLTAQAVELAKLHHLLDRGHNYHYIEMVTGWDRALIDEKRSLLMKAISDADWWVLKGDPIDEVGNSLKKGVSNANTNNMGRAREIRCASCGCRCHGSSDNQRD